MPAPKKVLNLTPAVMAKLRKQGKTLKEIAALAGCGWRTVKARLDAR